MLLFLFGKWCQCVILGDLYVSGLCERQTKGYLKARTEFIWSHLTLIEPLRLRIFFLGWVSCVSAVIYCFVLDVVKILVVALWPVYP